MTLMSSRLSLMSLVAIAWAAIACDRELQVGVKAPQETSEDAGRESGNGQDGASVSAKADAASSPSRMDAPRLDMAPSPAGKLDAAEQTDALAVQPRPDGGALSPYFPMNVGYSWTYRVTAPERSRFVPYTKIQIVDGRRLVGVAPYAGETAFFVRTAKRALAIGGGFDQATSWQRWDGARLVRLREQAFSNGGALPSADTIWQPPRLRVDESPARLRVGLSWEENYEEVRNSASGAPVRFPRKDTWTVIALDESVTVPRGTYRCLHLRNENVPRESNQVKQKHFWFARGVGKVKEVGDQTEELLDFVLVERRD